MKSPKTSSVASATSSTNSTVAPIVAQSRPGKTDFMPYLDAGFGGEVIPILPPDATMSPQSKGDPSQRGEIPGVYYPAHECWSGMPDWTTRVFTLGDARKWSRWPKANVGLRAKFFPAIAIDGPDAFLVGALCDVVFEQLGIAPVRRRNSSASVLLPYRLKKGTSTVPNMRINCRLWTPGETPETIEFLGNGQQYLIAGTHPSGAQYAWEGDMDLVSTTAAHLTEINSSDWTVLFMRLLAITSLSADVPTC